LAGGGRGARKVAVNKGEKWGVRRA